MMNPYILLFIIFFLNLGLGLGGHGIAVSYASKSKAKNELQDKQKRIGTEKKIIKNLSRKKSTLLGSLEALDKEIVKANDKYRVSKNRMDSLVKEIKELKRELKSLEKAIKKQWDENADRLVVFYRLGKSGMLPLLFSESSLPEKFQSLESLKKILLADWQVFQSFQALLMDKEKVKKGLDERLVQEKSLNKKIRNRKQALVTKRREKDGMLFRLEQDDEQHKRLLNELQRAAKALQQKIKEEKLLLDASSGCILIRQKGKLRWPVQGSIYRKFGNKAKVKSQGIDIKTDPGQPVRAVCSGGVVYADWFRGYGKLLIIHHGKKDYTIFSHMNRLTKNKGERVEKGEIIGHAGDTGSMEGCLVHFEIWHDGKPRDPKKWLKRK